jgi:hypothetical protein
VVGLSFVGFVVGFRPFVWSARTSPLENYCRKLPPGFPEFDHYKPFEFLLGMSPEEIDTLPGLEEALERFEVLFHDLIVLIT